MLDDLIKYRLQQAENTIKEVEFQIEHNFYQIAINRIYYGMFYGLLALALKKEFRTSKHNQLIGWFNKEFVKTGKTQLKFGKMLHKAYEDRSDGDYGVYVEFEKEELILKLEDMKEFIIEINRLIVIE